MRPRSAFDQMLERHLSIDVAKRHAYFCATMNEPPLPTPTMVHGNDGSPVILSMPHSGRDIPDWLASRAVGGRDALLSLSDPYVDAIAAPFLDEGLAAVIAHAPRAAIDPNRRPDELDPMIADGPPPPPGSKAANGIGLIPSRGRGRKPLWKTQIGTANVAKRLRSAWDPYHEALGALIEQSLARHGQAILLDLHSMPPARRGLPRVVLGDRHGKSANADLVEAIRRALVDVGEECALNHPYAGGAIVAMHGDPDRHVHAVQVEFDRSLYLEPRLRQPGPGLARARRLLAAIIDAATPDEAHTLAAE
ncbi:N-formylglutamate amidohydrolase [Sphingomicrobium clamense]|uniref:N-formylglutamate amidohydrolase n=1 Tax=Sphingomicrobium clamense TaxID=2851013 RepID=A0ABS6V7F4_9SPHN|nr:N-formylglutamate amidohydrolase [Sphingomicrobium sp. B8]MBW0145471.1 N-formylglutamate amidohydrolase [Sphingomicrobium sp. B8]